MLCLEKKTLYRLSVIFLEVQEHDAVTDELSRLGFGGGRRPVLPLAPHDLVSDVKSPVKTRKRNRVLEKRADRYHGAGLNERAARRDVQGIAEERFRRPRYLFDGELAEYLQFDPFGPGKFSEPVLHRTTPFWPQTNGPGFSRYSREKDAHLTIMHLIT